MKIRSQILLVFTSLILVLVIGFVYWIDDEIRPRYLEAQEETLVDLAQVMAALISERGLIENGDKVTINPSLAQSAFNGLIDRELRARIYQIEKTQVDIRIYITDRAGRVIFDSDNRDLSKDYSRWRDVALTLDGRYGARMTEADPLYPTGSTMYIAQPIMYRGDIIGVLSVGKPTRNAERFIAIVQRDLFNTAAIILVISILIGLLINLLITRPMKQLRDYAYDISLGERVSLPKFGNNEVGEVAIALDDMKLALDGKSYVSDYVQTLTHEIKAPVAGIRGAAELLQEDLAEPQRQKFLANIVTQTQRIQNLIERLMDLAKLEYQAGLAEVVSIDVDQLIADIIKHESDYAQSRRVGLALINHDSLSFTGDYFLVKQALSNLVKNAIEFSPENTTVTIETKQSNTGSEISVRDLGTGIPDYAINKVTQRFYSLARPNGQKGSGLGLSFVKEIMSLHHGELRLTPHSPSGTIATLHFN